jgi:hypothetical protein
VTSLILLAALILPSPGPVPQSGGTLRCGELVATYAIPLSADRNRPKVDTTGSCRALVAAADAIRKRFRRDADSIDWRRVDVPDLDTKKVTRYYQFVFALPDGRPSVIVFLPSFRVRIQTSD